MDELLRALARKYQRVPTPENASLYIRALEQAHGGQSDPSVLLEIWGSLILGLLDPHGVSAPVFDSLIDLTALLFSNTAAKELSHHINSVDGGFYITGQFIAPDDLGAAGDGWTEGDIFLSQFFEKWGYVCPTPTTTHPDACPKAQDNHTTCEALLPYNKSCKCPGCYSVNDPDTGIPRIACWHHYQIYRAGQRIGTRLYFQRPNPDDPLKDPNDNTGTLILLSIWGIRNGKKYCWWEDIIEMLDYVPIDHLRKVIRRLQDCGFIDSGPDGYTLYPAGFHVVKEALKGLPPPPTPPKIQRNPDEDIRALEREFRATRDRLTALKLFNAYQRAGINLAAQGKDFEFLVGYAILEPFITAYVEAYRDDGTAIMRDKLPGHQLVLTPRLQEAKAQLIAQSALIGYPSSYFCYRPYHHIPYVNAHMEELAILHNALIVDAWRDDDSYQGEAVFMEVTDAKAFIDAVVNQDLFQRESFRLRGRNVHPPAQAEFGNELSIVTWEQGK